MAKVLNHERVLVAGLPTDMDINLVCFLHTYYTLVFKAKLISE